MNDRNQSATSSAPTQGATRQILAGVAMAAMLCGVGLLHVASKVAAVEAGYQLGQLEDAHRTLERENVALKLQLATLRSAAHIETTAREKLAMTAPAPQRVFQLGGPVAPLIQVPPTRPSRIKKPAPRTKGTVGPAGTPVALLAPDKR